MSDTIKILRKLSYELQSTASYEDSSMVLAPLLSGIPVQSFDSIEDEAIDGGGFRDTSLQGPRKTGGSISQYLDKTSIRVLLKAAFGNEIGVTPQVLSPSDNELKLSIGGLDGVKYNQYADCYVTRLRIEGSAGQAFNVSWDFISPTAEVRAATAGYPTPAAFGERFSFHEMGGLNGYFRVGNCDDALDSGDNLCVEDFFIEISNMMDYQYSNCGIGSLTPRWGMGGNIQVTAGFTVARHDADDFLSWRDGDTGLQLDANIYKAADSQFRIYLPWTKCKASVSDDPTAKVNVELMVSRNGESTNYYNSNMAYNEPIRCTTTFA